MSTPATTEKAESRWTATWKKLLFAWTKADVNILLTSYLKPESRIQIYRDVHERVAQIAPFLRLDNDPYAVLSAGKLYWIQDAYTVSNYFPYANPERTTQSELRWSRAWVPQRRVEPKTPTQEGPRPAPRLALTG